MMLRRAQVNLTRLEPDSVVSFSTKKLKKGSGKDIHKNTKNQRATSTPAEYSQTDVSTNLAKTSENDIEHDKTEREKDATSRCEIQKHVAKAEERQKNVLKEISTSNVNTGLTAKNETGDFDISMIENLCSLLASEGHEVMLVAYHRELKKCFKCGSDMGRDFLSKTSGILQNFIQFCNDTYNSRATPVTTSPPGEVHYDIVKWDNSPGNLQHSRTTESLVSQSEYSSDQSEVIPMQNTDQQPQTIPSASSPGQTSTKYPAATPNASNSEIGRLLRASPLAYTPSLVANYGNLDQNMLNRMSEDSSFRCTKCEKVMGSKEELEQHMLVHSQSVFKCTVCEEVMQTKAALEQHQMAHSQRWHKCPHCSRLFFRKVDCDRHSVVHAIRTAEKCDFCNVMCVSKVGKNRHMKRQHPEEWKVICQTTLDLEKKGLKCPYCKSVFRSIEKMKTHMRYHKRKLQVTKCFICSEEFQTTQQLEEHVRIHTRSSKIPCLNCSERFDNALQLEHHKQVCLLSTSSIDLSVFKCSECNYEFETREEQDEHVFMTGHTVREIRSTDAAPGIENSNEASDIGTVESSSVQSLQISNVVSCASDSTFMESQEGHPPLQISSVVSYQDCMAPEYNNLFAAEVKNEPPDDFDDNMPPGNNSSVMSGTNSNNTYIGMSGTNYINASPETSGPSINNKSEKTMRIVIGQKNDTQKKKEIISYKHMVYYKTDDGKVRRMKRLRHRCKYCEYTSPRHSNVVRHLRVHKVPPLVRKGFQAIAPAPQVEGSGRETLQKAKTSQEKISLLQNKTKRRTQRKKAGQSLSQNSNQGQQTSAPVTKEDQSEIQSKTEMQELTSTADQTVSKDSSQGQQASPKAPVTQVHADQSLLQNATQKHGLSANSVQSVPQITTQVQGTLPATLVTLSDQSVFQTATPIQGLTTNAGQSVPQITTQVQGTLPATLVTLSDQSVFQTATQIQGLTTNAGQSVPQVTTQEQRTLFVTHIRPPANKQPESTDNQLRTVLIKHAQQPNLTAQVRLPVITTQVQPNLSTQVYQPNNIAHLQQPAYSKGNQNIVTGYIPFVMTQMDQLQQMNQGQLKKRDPPWKGYRPKGNKKKDQEKEKSVPKGVDLGSKTLCHCLTCNADFTSYDLLQEHMKEHIAKNDFRCHLCGLAFPSKDHLLIHKLSSNSICRFGCTYCGDVLPTRYGFWNHRKAHMKKEDKNYRCFVEGCDKKYEDFLSLRRHLVQMHINQGNKQYFDFEVFECGICSQVFALQADLESHVRIHRRHHDPFPFSCDECGKAFHDEASLERHMEMHKGETDGTLLRQCFLCKKTFQTKKELARHFLSVHSNAANAAVTPGESTSVTSEKPEAVTSKEVKVVISNDCISVHSDENSDDSKDLNKEYEKEVISKSSKEVITEDHSVDKAMDVDDTSSENEMCIDISVDPDQNPYTETSLKEEPPSSSRLVDSSDVPDSALDGAAT